MVFGGVCPREFSKLGATCEEAVHELHEFHELERTKRVKVRFDQSVPSGHRDEIIVAINASNSCNSWIKDSRLALPVYTAEPEFNKLRVASLGTDPLKVKTVWRLAGSVPANSLLHHAVGQSQGPIAI